MWLTVTGSEHEHACGGSLWLLVRRMAHRCDARTPSTACPRLDHRATAKKCKLDVLHAAPRCLLQLGLTLAASSVTLSGVWRSSLQLSDAHRASGHLRCARRWREVPATCRRAGRATPACGGFRRSICAGACVLARVGSVEGRETDRLHNVCRLWARLSVVR